MKSPSRRMRRMDRHHRLRKASPLNLVSLMDIFTILVFFLLVNSSSAPQLPSPKTLTLPKSTAQKAPSETLVLLITPNSMLLQGRQVMTMDQLKSHEDEAIAPLVEELQLLTSNRQFTDVPDAEEGGAITIMGDENIPYELLRKILASLRQANYTNIAFAAQQEAKSST